MNFTYVLRKPPDGNWGLQNADGSWNGIVGQLIDDQIDIGKSPFTVCDVILDT